VDDLPGLDRAGVLGPEERIELVGGDLLSMTPTGARHGAGVARATRTLIQTVGVRAVTWIQSSIRLDEHTAPQPDIVLLRPREDFYAARLPEAGDVLLVVEIADSSVAYDRSVKAALYAAAGLPEYWLLDLDGDCLLVHAAPAGAAWGVIERSMRGERVSPALLPDCAVRVDDLLA
jgi:Uma2 family endonuclease